MSELNIKHGDIEIGVRQSGNEGDEYPGLELFVQVDEVEVASFRFEIRVADDEPSKADELHGLYWPLSIDYMSQEPVDTLPYTPVSLVEGIASNQK